MNWCEGFLPNTNKDIRDDGTFLLFDFDICSCPDISGFPVYLTQTTAKNECHVGDELQRSGDEQ